MRHQLMNPDFPDLVGQVAARPLELCGSFLSVPSACNDDDDDDDNLAEAFLSLLGRLEVAATRLW
jgi:hypothetical protein